MANTRHGAGIVGDAAGGGAAPAADAAAAAAAAAQSGIDASSLKGSGPGGRILKEDVQKHASSPAAAAGVREERRQPMSILRQTIARRLVEAQHNAALLTTFNECDVSAIKKAREQYQDAFSKKYGIKLGFMSFFVKAVVDALNLFPAIGARIDGTDLVYRNYCDIGVAIGSGRGRLPSITDRSEWQSPAARMRTSTSPGPGASSSTSSSVLPSSDHRKQVRF